MSCVSTAREMIFFLGFYEPVRFFIIVLVSIYIVEQALCTCHRGPRAYLGQCGDFEINTSPCSGGNMGTPVRVNAGAFARHCRLRMSFFWLIEDGGSNWRLEWKKVFLSCNIICFAKPSFILSWYCCFFTNFRLHCTILISLGSLKCKSYSLSTLNVRSHECNYQSRLFCSLSLSIQCFYFYRWLLPYQKFNL